MFNELPFSNSSLMELNYLFDLVITVHPFYKGVKFTDVLELMCPRKSRYFDSQTLVVLCSMHAYALDLRSLFPKFLSSMKTYSWAIEKALTILIEDPMWNLLDPRHTDWFSTNLGPPIFVRYDSEKKWGYGMSPNYFC